MANIATRLEELEQQQSSSDFWSDQKHAQSVIKEYNNLKNLRDKYYKNDNDITSLLSELDELNKNYDADLFELLNEEYVEISKEFEDFEINVLLSNDYDHSNAILEIHPGAGS